MPSHVREQYTPAPGDKKTRCLPTPPYCSTRYRLLKDLATEIWEDEKNAEFLFRSFDLIVAEEDLDEEPDPGLSVHQITPPSPTNLIHHFEKATTICSHSATSTSLPAETHPAPVIHLSDNPFLSTPLRLKHFPRLSPSILRGLLRSPSLRVPTPDSSFADEMTDFSIAKHHEAALESSGSMTGYKSPDSCEGHNQDSYPLTPPSPGRMPTLNRFQLSPGHANSNSDPPTGPLTHLRTLILPHTSYSSPFATNTSYSSYSTAKHSEHTIEETCPASKCSSNSLTDVENLSRAFQHIDKLISPAASRNFGLVVNESKGTENNPDEQRRTLLSSLRTSVYLPLSTPDLPSSNRDDKNASLQFSGSFPPSHRQSQTPRKLGSLEVEFTTLLLQRALQEEAEADQLRVLARRLEWLAKGKRELARVVISAMA